MSRRVLIVDHTSSVGGAELSMEALVTAMPRERYRFVAALPNPGHFGDRLRARGIDVHFVPLESWRWWGDEASDYVRFMLTAPAQPLSVTRWVRFIRRIDPDIIHFNINRLVEPIIAAHLAGVTSIVHFRDIPSSMSPPFFAGRAAFYQIMNLADAWIANSKATAADISPRARRRVVTIPNGIDLTEFDDQFGRAQARGDGSTPQSIVMIAGLMPWKRHDIFLAVAEKVVRVFGGSRWIIAGAGDVTLANRLREAVRASGLEHNVSFAGHVNNVPGLLSKTALLLHTTPVEPFGRVLIEAMAAGRPVVAFNAGGPAEIVLSGKTGLLVPAGDVEAMAEAVCCLLRDPDMAACMGKLGRSRVEAEYTLGRHVRAVTELYDTLLSERGRRHVA